MSRGADKKAVEQTTTTWIDTVTLGTYDAPKKTAELYAPDGVFWGTEVYAPGDPLWGTASELVRNTPEQIYAYYVSDSCLVLLLLLGSFFVSLFSLLLLLLSLLLVQVLLS